MWLDAVDRAPLPPSWIDEFGVDAFAGVPTSAHGFSAVRTVDKLRDWFTDSERQRLYSFGFFLVEVPNAQVIRESAHQVLCWRDLPLTFGVTNRRPI